MVDAILLGRFTAAIAKGNALLVGPMEHGSMGDYVPSGPFFEWQSQSLTLLHQVFGPDHPYATTFNKWTEKYQYASNVQTGIGTLKAAQEDVANGHVRTIQELVHAEVFDDFLSMADYLVKDGGYKDATAVLAGSTLEEHLRKLCQKHGISTMVTKPNGSTEPKKASAMNIDLRTQTIYNQLDWRQVDAWLDIRNKAAHGDYGQYTRQQVEQMIDGVRGFMARNPA